MIISVPLHVAAGPTSRIGNTVVRRPYAAHRVVTRHGVSVVRLRLSESNTIVRRWCGRLRTYQRSVLDFLRGFSGPQNISLRSSEDLPDMRPCEDFLRGFSGPQNLHCMSSGDPPRRLSNCDLRPDRGPCGRRPRRPVPPCTFLLGIAPAGRGLCWRGLRGPPADLLRAFVMRSSSLSLSTSVMPHGLACVFVAFV